MSEFRLLSGAARKYDAAIGWHVELPSGVTRVDGAVRAGYRKAALRCDDNGPSSRAGRLVTSG